MKCFIYKIKRVELEQNYYFNSTLLVLSNIVLNIKRICKPFTIQNYTDNLSLRFAQ